MTLCCTGLRVVFEGIVQFYHLQVDKDPAAAYLLQDRVNCSIVQRATIDSHQFEYPTIQMVVSDKF